MTATQALVVVFGVLVCAFIVVLGFFVLRASRRAHQAGDFYNFAWWKYSNKFDAYRDVEGKEPPESWK